jgi:hypothetical protein
MKTKQEILKAAKLTLNMMSHRELFEPYFWMRCFNERSVASIIDLLQESEETRSINEEILIKFDSLSDDMQLMVFHKIQDDFNNVGNLSRDTIAAYLVFKCLQIDFDFSKILSEIGEPLILQSLNLVSRAMIGLTLLHNDHANHLKKISKEIDLISESIKGSKQND